MEHPRWRTPIAAPAILCQQVGDTPQLFPVLYGLWSVARVGATLQTAQELAEELFGSIR